MGVENPVDRYNFDRAIYTFGVHVDSELDSVHEKDDKSGQKTKRKKQLILEKYIPEIKKASSPSKKFRDPGKR